MSQNVRFGVRITGDDRGAVRAMRNTGQESQRLNRRLSQTEKQTRRTSQSFQGWARSLNTIQTAIGPLAGAAGAGVLAQFTKRTIKNTAAIKDNADTAGVSAERFQLLTKGFKDLGNVAESVTSGALRRFQRRFGLAAQGTGAAVDTLDRLSINLNQDTGPALEQTIERLARIEDDANRAAAASQVFGEDAGPQLAGALGQGEQALNRVIERLRESNRIMSEESVEAASEYNQRWQQITDTLSSFAQRAAVETISALDSIDERLLENPGLAFGVRRDIFSGFTEGADEAADKSDALSGVLGNLEDQLNATRRAAKREREVLEQAEIPGARQRLEQAEDEIETLERRRELLQFIQEGAQIEPPVDPEQTEAARDAEEKLGDMLKRRLDILGDLKTDEERFAERRAELQELTASGLLTEQEFAQALTQAREEIIGTSDATDFLKEERREAARVTEKLRTEEEKFADEVARLNDLQDSGLLTVQTYVRGLADAAGGLNNITDSSDDAASSAEDFADRSGLAAGETAQSFKDAAGEIRGSFATPYSNIISEGFL